jgi:hypothetical protein
VGLTRRCRAVRSATAEDRSENEIIESVTIEVTAGDGSSERIKRIPAKNPSDGGLRDFSSSLPAFALAENKPSLSGVESRPGEAICLIGSNN